MQMTRNNWLIALVSALSGLLFFLATHYLAGDDDHKNVMRSAPPPPLELKFPESIKSDMLIRPFGEEAWHDARSIDTSTRQIYEIKLTGNAADVVPTLSRRQIVSESSQAVIKNRWFDYEKAVADGFEKVFHGDPFHYINRKYSGDGETLNPEKPEALMFYPTPKGKVLAGVMYLADHVSDIPAQVSGKNAYWHFHRWYNVTCWAGGLPADPVATGECPEGATVGDQSPLMIHVWFAKHPGGDFGTQMTLPTNAFFGENSADTSALERSLELAKEKLTYSSSP